MTLRISISDVMGLQWVAANGTHPNAVIHKGAPRTHSSLSLALAQTH